jgi:hypothetical protein
MRWRNRYLLLILPALLVRYALDSRQDVGSRDRDEQETIAAAHTAPPAVVSRSAPVEPPLTAALPPLAASQPQLEPSHPLTVERELIQHELQLIGALNDALDLRDAARMRMLIDSYREFHPDDEHQLQEGYERLADCLEFPGGASRSEAQVYYDQARASPLRRFIRRLCLEPDGA